MINEKDPAGGAPTGQDRSIIRNSDTILSSSEHLNDFPHPHPDRKRSPIPRIMKMRIWKNTAALLSYAAYADEQAEKYARLADCAMKRGDFETAEKHRITYSQFFYSSRRSYAIIRDTFEHIDDIVGTIHQLNTPLTPLPAISVPAAKYTERRARITLADRLREAAAQMRGSAAPPPAGFTNLSFFSGRRRAAA